MKRILLLLSSFLLLVATGIIFFIFDEKQIGNAALSLLLVSLIINIIDSITKNIKETFFFISYQNMVSFLSGLQ